MSRARAPAQKMCIHHQPYLTCLTSVLLSGEEEGCRHYGALHGAASPIAGVIEEEAQKGTGCFHGGPGFQEEASSEWATAPVGGKSTI